MWCEIILRARVGYKITDLATIVTYIQQSEWNNCFIENNREKSLNLADFPLTRTLTIFSSVGGHVKISGSHTMNAQPIKTLELSYPMNQFLINTSMHDRHELRRCKELNFLGSSPSCCCILKILSSVSRKTRDGTEWNTCVIPLKHNSLRLTRNIYN